MMEEQNPLQATIKSIHQSNFVAAKDHVQDALYTKAKHLIQAKKQEIAANLTNTEVHDGGNERSGQG